MARDVRIVAGGFSLLESPRWKDGRLYVSDFYTRRVLVFDADGSHDTIVEVEGQPSGLGWDPQDRLLISSMNDQKLLRFDGEKLAEVAALSEWTDGPANDMVVDANGRAYIGNFGDLTELGRTSLVRVDADGTVTKAADDVFFPNGSCITPDGKTLLVAETFKSRISAFDVGLDGTLSNRRDWATFADPIDTTDMVEATKALPILPDGMCLDAEGCLWVACAKGHGVYRVREGGEILEKIETVEQTVFAPMLGGEDGKTLYLCCAAPILTVDHASSHEATLRSCTVDVPRAGLP
ncbi:SMP-30/gluconolactonase/LRE family protein [Streptomyces sp. NPDC058228]|uniref:SMP-30/gluconolactonase/LRE family protein n=1 Tax=Streptomyces sp. NPDC058228 TaxID=3346390 RepID=UPI0036ED4CBF